MDMSSGATGELDAMTDVEAICWEISISRVLGMDPRPPRR